MRKNGKIEDLGGCNARRETRGYENGRSMDKQRSGGLDGIRSLQRSKSWIACR